MSKRFWRNFLIVILGLLVLEAALRFIGFGSIPLYYSSAQFEYALKPNQDINRFGNQIYINKEGMRSDELDANSNKILKFGDSVLNGGVAIDQSELASSILQADLNQEGGNYQVLNVSAGSWGAGNAYAWLMEHGDYRAKAIVLLFSSHDWQDQMTFQKVVGETPFYPDENPVLAITDAVSWTYSRFFNSVDWNELGYSKVDRPSLKDHDYGWNKFITYCAERDIPLLVYHHANKKESKTGEWSEMGVELERFLMENQVRTISGLNAGLEPIDYRDEIHPEPSGLLKIEKAILPELKIIQKN